MPVSGIITKAYGGFFYITVPKRGSHETIEATLPGRLKKEKSKLPPVIVGDKVDYSVQEGQASIIYVHPRKTELFRPPVANIDQVVVVTAAAIPVPDTSLMDKILVQAEAEVLDIVITINKMDAADPKVIEELTAHYKGTGYPIVHTSANQGKGLEDLFQLLQGKISVLAGSSGVGKSSLLKRLVPGYAPQTQPVSEKSSRGRHTTKHVELLALPQGGYIADTPGFSNISLDGIELQELPLLFPEFSEILSECRFSGCIHVPEPGCRVKEYVSQGLISKSRYESYCRMIDEIAARKKW